MTLADDSFVKAARIVENWRRPLLISHTKPDGDAIGSLVGLRTILKQRGLDPRDVMFDPLPERYGFISRMGTPALWGRDTVEADLDGFDGLVVLDTGTHSQLEPVSNWLKTSRLPKVVVDHHQTRDPLGAYELVDVSAAATSLILLDWARKAGWTIDAAAATALYFGLSTDTGWFRHSNTDARAFRAAAELLEAGADSRIVYQSVFQMDSPGRLRLLAAALNSMELHAGDQFAVQILRRSDFERCVAKLSDTEDVVNEPLRIATVVVSILLVEQDPALTRVNLRSRTPPEGSAPDVDVSRIAAEFGGGGHARAAGARVARSLDAARDDVIRRVRCEFGD